MGIIIHVFFGDWQGGVMVFWPRCNFGLAQVHYGKDRSAFLLPSIPWVRGESASGPFPYVAAFGLRGGAHGHHHAAHWNDVEDGSVWLSSDTASDFLCAAALADDAAVVACPC